MMPNRVVLGIAILFFSIAACDRKADRAGAGVHKNEAVSLYEGYTMPTLLAQPLPVVNTADLSEIDKRKWYATFQVHVAANPEKIIALSSCDDYLAQSSERLQTVSEKDGSAFMEIALMCRATRLIQAATPSEKSYLQSLAFDDKLPGTLPASFAMVLSQSEQARLDADKAIKHWGDVHRITKVETLKPFHANYYEAGGLQELTLVARGDFNGDKIEDMLITSRDSVEGGSYSATRLFLITRTSDSSAVSVLNEYKY